MVHFLVMSLFAKLLQCEESDGSYDVSVFKLRLRT